MDRVGRPPANFLWVSFGVRVFELVWLNKMVLGALVDRSGCIVNVAVVFGKRVSVAFEQAFD